MIWHPYTIQLDSDPPLKIHSAKGEFLYDENGKEYVDAISSWWVSIHGHNHPKIAAEVKAQLDKLDHVLLAGFTHPPALEFAHEILEFADWKFHKVVYSDNGSTALEIMLKIAFQFFRNQGDTKRKIFVTFSSSYHGDTIGAMSVGGDSVFNRVFQSLLFPTKNFPSPACHDCPVGKSPHSCAEDCLDELEAFLSAHSPEVVGVLIEPLIAGAGGMLFHKPEVLTRLREMTRRYGVLLLLDEVFTGFGRTGTDFAFQAAGIEPDMIALSKGLTAGFLPLGVTLVREEIYREFASSDPLKAFYHGHTMTGYPPGCAAALASLKVYKEENRLQDVKRLESLLEEGWSKLRSEFPEKIRNVRILGSVGVGELFTGNAPSGYTNSFAREFRRLCQARGVILRPLGNVIYITPPYNISKSSLDRVFEAVREAISVYNVPD
ncbi:adenosylmethionine--8-amino-7-oxononanoate transaminase [Leptospira wolffii]|uniref:Adenosylmethionine-8-amino-7-oxononanoate aminotransferase n=1 Tax=Leptospira wolffii TaxID=409998 RepID=A0ABV5BQ09_9LEPT|nr:adenosylmethionine--8-amino-7-oxononanoate transaminase [Leptospira wolffii]EPG67348.1 adenosylmethionine-8-amino-7-oxononanoate transaminase [Leptospira wolffii serovar Khorat str. Khorat-H2]TGK56824.1 adenosylmethionine--8-amino-7-oxononanoate transaminase [Leptospira wolffii]TGK71594.1 adenosylmethionine--8-amino-7-oxononanoate transaminase [Leptospira wolffii]TGK75549.1 adenosylmethionine--8-amino-7-oxononanoate transaminase [Leptospira wolffii]TGL32961.1 adenosylmethionine--8-amino-7-o